MPYELKWLITDYVLYSRIWNVLTDEEIAISSKITADFFDTAARPVFLLVNSLDLHGFPKHLIQAVSHAQLFMTHHNMHQLVVVSNSSPVKFASVLIAQIQHGKLITRSTLEEALAYIGKQVPEIADQLHPPSV